MTTKHRGKRGPRVVKTWPQTPNETTPDTEPIKQEAQVAEQPKARPKRIPIGQRNVLTYPERPGYKRRVVSDVDDRVERFKEAGYTPVISAGRLGDPMLGDPSSIGSAVTKSVGGGVRGVLMEIPEEYYSEDQAAKQSIVDKSEESLNAEARNKGLNHGEVKISRS